MSIMFKLSNVKLLPKNFTYYLLAFDQNLAPDIINDKLISLKKFDVNAKYIVLDPQVLMTEDELLLVINTIDSIVVKHGFIIQGIKSTPLYNQEKFAGKQVIDLPDSNQQEKEISISETKIILDPVRSGAVVTNDGDIIVNNLISHNAEIISSGNIHVYSECRGKLIAGVTGDKTKRIFVSMFNAEYISIAGVFRKIENDLPKSLHNKAVQIFLDEKDRLNIVQL